jgi:hypothetical protein
MAMAAAVAMEEDAITQTQWKKMQSHKQRKKTVSESSFPQRILGLPWLRRVSRLTEFLYRAVSRNYRAKIDTTL